MIPDFSRLQVGKHDVLVLRFDSPGHLDNFWPHTLHATLKKHLGFEGIIVQLVGDVDLEMLSAEAGRQLYRALAEKYGDAEAKTCPICRPEVDPSGFEQQGSPDVD